MAYCYSFNQVLSFHLATIFQSKDKNGLSKILVCEYSLEKVTPAMLVENSFLNASKQLKFLFLNFHAN